MSSTPSSTRVNSRSRSGMSGSTPSKRGGRPGKVEQPAQLPPLYIEETAVVADEVEEVVEEPPVVVQPAPVTHKKVRNRFGQVITVSVSKQQESKVPVASKPSTSPIKVVEGPPASQSFLRTVDDLVTVAEPSVIISTRRLSESSSFFLPLEQAEGMTSLPAVSIMKETKVPVKMPEEDKDQSKVFPLLNISIPIRCAWQVASWQNIPPSLVWMEVSSESHRMETTQRVKQTQTLLGLQHEGRTASSGEHTTQQLHSGWKHMQMQLQERQTLNSINALPHSSSRRVSRAIHYRDVGECQRSREQEEVAPDALQQAIAGCLDQARGKTQDLSSLGFKDNVELSDGSFEKLALFLGSRHLDECNCTSACVCVITTPWEKYLLQPSATWASWLFSQAVTKLRSPEVRVMLKPPVPDARLSSAQHVLLFVWSSLPRSDHLAISSTQPSLLPIGVVLSLLHTCLTVKSPVPFFSNIARALYAWTADVTSLPVVSTARLICMEQSDTLQMDKDRRHIYVTADTLLKVFTTYPTICLSASTYFHIPAPITAGSASRSILCTLLAAPETVLPIKPIVLQTSLGITKSLPTSKTVDIALGLSSWLETPVYPTSYTREQQNRDNQQYSSYHTPHSVLSSNDHLKLHNWGAYTLPPAACLPGDAPPPVPSSHMSLAPPHGILNINGTSINLYTVYGIHPFSGYWAWREMQVLNNICLPFYTKHQPQLITPSNAMDEGILLALAHHNTFASKQAHQQHTKTHTSQDIPLQTFYAASGHAGSTIQAFEMTPCGTLQCNCQNFKLSSIEQVVYLLTAATLPHPFTLPQKLASLTVYSQLVYPLKKQYIAKLAITVTDLYMLLKSMSVLQEVVKPLAHMIGIRINQCSRHQPPHPVSMCVCGPRLVNNQPASYLVAGLLQAMQFITTKFQATGVPTHTQQCKEIVSILASYGSAQLGMQLYPLLLDNPSQQSTQVLTLLHTFLSIQCTLSMETKTRQYLEQSLPATQIPFNIAFGPKCFDLTTAPLYFPSDKVFVDSTKTPYDATPSTIFQIHSDGSLVFDKNMANSFVVCEKQNKLQINDITSDPVFQQHKNIVEGIYPGIRSLELLSPGKVVLGKAVGLTNPTTTHAACTFPFASELFHNQGVQNITTSSLARVMIDALHGDIYLGSEHSPMVCVFGTNSLFWTQEEAVYQGCVIRAMAMQQNSVLTSAMPQDVSGLGVYIGVLGMPIGLYRELYSIYKASYKEQNLVHDHALYQLHRMIYQQYTAQTDESLFHTKELRYDGRDPHSDILEQVPWAPRMNSVAAQMQLENAKRQQDAVTGDFPADLQCLEENALLWSKIGSISKPNDVYTTTHHQSKAIDTQVDSMATGATMHTGQYINTNQSPTNVGSTPLSPVHAVTPGSPTSSGANNAAGVLWRRLQKQDIDDPMVFVNPLNGANSIVASLHANTAKVPCTSLGTPRVQSTVMDEEIELNIIDCTMQYKEMAQLDVDKLNVPCISIFLNTGIYPFSCAQSSVHYSTAVSTQKPQTALSLVRSLGLSCSQILASDLEYPKLQQEMVLKSVFVNEDIVKQAYPYIFRIFYKNTPPPVVPVAPARVGSALPGLQTKKKYNGILPVGWKQPLPHYVHTWSSYPPQSVKLFKAACFIQVWWRKMKQRDQRNRDHRKKTHAATQIQRQYRKHLHKRVARLQVAAIKIQAVWRGYKGREYVKIVREYGPKAHIADNAARKIQNLVRKFQKQKLLRVKNVLLHEQAGYITSLVSFFQQCYRVRMQQKLLNEQVLYNTAKLIIRKRTTRDIHSKEDAAKILQQTQQTVTEYVEPISITSTTQLSCCQTLLKLLSAVRMRLSLSEVDKTVRNMVEKRRAESVQRRGKVLAVILVQKKWRRIRKRIQQRKQIESLRASLVTVRNALRRYVLFVRLTRVYGQEKALTLLRFFDSMNFYPNPN